MPDAPTPLATSPDGSVSPSGTFSILLLSEGFMDSDDFLSACATAAAGLLNLTPFTSTKTWLSAYASFTPSSSAGPTGPTAGATPFGSTLDPSTNTLSIDSTAVFNYVGDWSPGQLAFDDGFERSLRVDDHCALAC